MGISQVTALKIANTLHGPAADLEAPSIRSQNHDHLDDPGHALEYLSGQGLDVPDKLPTAAELERLRRFRRAIRALSKEHSGQAREHMQALLARYTYRLDLDGSLTPTSSGWDGVIASALPGLLSLFDQNERLQMCANPECRWLFIDRSRNHSRVWCDMGTCGSRAKMARYRDRKREDV